MTLIGQLQVLLVGFLVAGQLTAAQLTSLRTVQTAILQPQQNLIQAMIGLLVPRVSRLAGDAARGGEEALVAAAALRRQTRLFATVFAGLGLLAALVVAPLGYVVLRHIGKFAADAPLAVPIALQAGIYLAEMPFQAALRAMHRGRLLFARYAVFAASSLTGLVLGAHYGQLLGAAWGLCAGAAVGFATMMTMYRYAVRHLGDPPLERVGE
jgi:O-antigen/teichoic acid export membrane protein